MKLSTFCNKKRTLRIHAVTSQDANIENQRKADPRPTQLAQLLLLRQELRSLLLHTFQHIQPKIKATCYSTSNKAGKKLAQHIKERRIKTKITHLFHPHTREKLTNPQDIANAFSDYYSDLYNIRKNPSTCQHSNEDINIFLQQMKLPTLTDTQLSFLNEPFMEQEIHSTITSLPTGKAPGPDDPTGEYYRQFSSQLTPHLTQLFINTASSSEFATELLNALIIALLKPGKEPISPQNFHPISLLNLDLKMYTKTIGRHIWTLIL